MMVAIRLLMIVGVSLGELILKKPVTQFVRPVRLGAGIFLLFSAALLDYFQPFSLYDDMIYFTLAGFMLLLIRFILDARGYIRGGTLGLSHLLLGCGVLLFLVSFWGWSVLQGNFDFENIESDPIHFFVGSQDGYTIYRIPGLMVIPQGAQLASEPTLVSDRWRSTEPQTTKFRLTKTPTLLIVELNSPIKSNFFDLWQ
jgi:hypothetical protein